MFDQQQKTINAKCTNLYIIKYTMGGDLELPMIPGIDWKARIYPNIKHSLVYIGYICDA